MAADSAMNRQIRAAAAAGSVAEHPDAHERMNALIRAAAGRGGDEQ